MASMMKEAVANTVPASSALREPKRAAIGPARRPRIVIPIVAGSK